ncbi:MAG TPA: hypothetical protein VK783_03395 [Bacteroidia bacterium]|jgi:hypothetical protein|nr:hypothetical protein [Bacteroidia bacterium]
MMNIFSKSKWVFGSLICLVVFIALSNTSCKQSNNYAKQTATLDSLNKAVHAADSVLSMVDTVRIKKCTDHITIALELIKMAHKDSMSKTSAEIFRNYSSVRWELLTFSGRRSFMLIEMHKSMDQLTHLSHDLKNNLIMADSVPIYYNQEVKRASLLIESEQMGMAKLNSQLPLYNLIVPQADSLISLIKNHKDI